jgi:hypothetical protein
MYLFSLAAPFKADSGTTIFNKTKETATMDCQWLTTSIDNVCSSIFQVIKYTVVYILMIALLAALIVLRMF